MTRFVFETKGEKSFRTDCPEIALKFGSVLLETDECRAKLQSILQPFLDVHAAVRTYIVERGTIMDQSPEAEAICVEISKLSKQRIQITLGKVHLSMNTEQ